MSEWIAGAKLSVIGAAVVGGLLSLPYLKMTMKQKLLAVPCSVFMAYEFSEPLSAWLGIESGAIGALMGLFGMSICHLILESLQKSDLSFSLKDIIELWQKKGD